MRAHFSNSLYGIFDYAAQPLAMILAAPLLLRHLGIAAYGIWLIASAAVGAGSLVSSGFGDAVIQRVATLRVSSDVDGIRNMIAALLTINLMLGALLGIALWAVIPFITSRITHFDPSLRGACLSSLRIGAGLIVLKSIESVFVNAQRAFETYGSTVRIAVAIRLLTTLIAIVLAVHGFGVPALMIGAAILTVAGVVLQWVTLRPFVGHRFIWPKLHRATSSNLLTYGGFTWLQALSGVLFSQADKLLLGATLGASAVTYYGICVQMTQPIHGLTAAGLHFLFPHLAKRYATGSLPAMRRPIFLALVVNIVSATGLTTGFMLFGTRILALWMGAIFATKSANLLVLLALGFGLLALNVTGHYTLLAIGKVHLVTALNIAGGTAMLLTMAAFIHNRGVEGAAWARMLYGPITCLFYLPLWRLLNEASPLPPFGLPKSLGGQA